MEGDERKEESGGGRKDPEDTAPQEDRRRWRDNRERAHNGGEDEAAARSDHGRRKERDTHDDRPLRTDERRRKERDEHRDRPRSDDRRRDADSQDDDWRRKESRRGHRGGSSRNRDPSARGSREGSRDPNASYDSLVSTTRKKKRIEEKEKQECTIFVGDLDPSSTAEQLTGLFKKFGTVLSAKIKDDHCYGFVTFDKRESAEAAIAAGQNQDGIDLLNNKQVYVSWALGSLPEWKKGIGGFTVSPSKQQSRNRSRKGVVKPSVLAAATAAAAAKAHAVLAGDLPSPSWDEGNYRGRAVVAYDDLL